MIKQSFISLCLVIAVIVIVVGCEHQRKKDAGVLDRGPDFEKLVVPGDYADAAIKATGGLQNWAKITKLQLDCVVTFYQPDDSFYLTEHRFYIYPWSNSIEVTAREPFGVITWQLSDEQFRNLLGDESRRIGNPDESGGVSCRDYIEAILKMTTAPVQFLRTGVSFVRLPNPIKMEGLWYYPIESAWRPANRRERQEAVGTPASREPKPYWSKVIYYQNRDNSLVDLLWLADIEQGKFLAVRGYDYKPVPSKAEPAAAHRDEPDMQKTGVLLPTKIEIFRTDARAVSRERLVKIDLKSR